MVKLSSVDEEDILAAYDDLEKAVNVLKKKDWSSSVLQKAYKLSISAASLLQNVLDSQVTSAVGYRKLKSRI